MERVLEVRRKDTLVKKEKNKDNRIPLVVTYHPDLPPVGQIINKHWPMLHHKDRTKKIFKNRPIVSYKRPRNLRDMLVKSTFNYQENLWNNGIGCSPCKRCSWCKNVKTTAVFKSRATGEEFDIFHSVTWIIYLDECTKCSIQYCRIAETSLNIRFNNNRKWLKDRLLTRELVDHFAKHHNHDFEKDLSIMIIEHLKSSSLNTAQKKATLKKREKFWQAKLKTFAPHALNARLGLPF